MCIYEQKTLTRINHLLVVTTLGLRTNVPFGSKENAIESNVVIKMLDIYLPRLKELRVLSNLNKG